MTDVVAGARERGIGPAVPVMGALATAAGLAFLASLLVGPSGTGLPRGRGRPHDLR